MVSVTLFSSVPFCVHPALVGVRLSKVTKTFLWLDPVTALSLFFLDLSVASQVAYCSSFDVLFIPWLQDVLLFNSFHSYFPSVLCGLLSLREFFSFCSSLSGCILSWSSPHFVLFLLFPLLWFIPMILRLPLSSKAGNQSSSAASPDLSPRLQTHKSSCLLPFPIYIPHWPLNIHMLKISSSSFPIN